MLICKTDSPLGTLTLASDGRALTGLWLPRQREADAAENQTNAVPVFEAAQRWLDVYFSGRAPDFTPPLRLQGSAFQQAIWQLLLAIPFGETTTYGALAEAYTQKTGHGTAARAVGGAVGKNPVGIIVPCHRVIGADGSLTGYAGGLENKKKLLALEGWQN